MSANNITVSIAGTIYPVKDRSFKFSDKIEQRSTCSFILRNDAGTAHFRTGQQVVVADSSATIFTGTVNTSEEDKVPGQAMLWMTVDSIDPHFKADKRTTSKIYTGQYSGIIVADMHQDVLSAEGITALYALRNDESQSDFAAGTLTNTLSTSNVGDGDLELALSGAQVVVSGAGAGFGTGPGLLFTGYASSGYTNAYNYRQIWSGTEVISNGQADFLTYDLWISSDSPQIMSGVDFICSDGTTLRDTATALDFQGLSPHPNTDLSGLANDQWYSRTIFMPSALNAKTINAFAVAMEGDNQGAYTSYFRNIIYHKNTGTIGSPAYVSLNIFTSSLQMNSQILNNGYSNVSLTQAVLQNKSALVTHSSLAIGAAVLVRDSIMTWTETLPSGCTGLVETSIDNQASWQAITSGSAVPNLLAGMKVSSRVVYYRHTMTLAKDPTVTIGFGGPTLTINSAYAATKSDVITTYTTATDFATGTLTDLKTVGSTTTPAITTNGFQRNWDDASYSNQTLYGSSGPVNAVVNKQFQLGSNNGTDARSRLDFAGTWADFTAEIDLQAISVNASTGLVYRTTNWGNSNDSYAYAVSVSMSSVLLGRGSNSTGAGAFVSIANVLVNLTQYTFHRLKIVATGSNHKVYLDNVLLINATDATYLSAGYLGIRTYDNVGGPVAALYDNFGVCSALSGTWQSPSIDISGATTYGNSMVQWDIDGLPDSTTTITAQTSINGGSTWQAVTNGGSISGLSGGGSLSGVHLLLKLTLTAANAPIVPVLNGVTAWVMGQYSASGTRVSPVLALTPVGRVGSTLVAWNANLPTSTALVMATSPDGTTWTTVTSGSPITGITQQPDLVLDTFTTNTSANYTSTAVTGGATATWTYDTANSRISASGGTNGIFRYDGLSIADSYIEADMDQAANAGLVCRITAAGTMYALYIFDASASGTPNTFKLDSIVTGTHTTLASGAISFTRGDYHKFRLSCIGTTISVLMDGASLASVTNSAVAGAGKSGMLATTLLRVYNLRIQGMGDDLASKNVYTRATLTSTDPTVTPQLLDLTIAALSPDIGVGALIPTVDYRDTYVSANMDDLSTKSDYYWMIRPDLSLFFGARKTTPAPWILTSSDQLLLLNGLKVTTNGDLYRNRQKLTGVLSTAIYSDTKLGDGTATSWNVGYQVAATPSITVNGRAQTVGVKGTSGYQFYWEQGSTTITQDASQAVLQGPNTATGASADVLGISYTGQFLITVTRDNTGGFAGTTTQAQFAADSGDSGIVEMVEDVSGLNLSVAAANAYGDSLLQRYGVIGRTIDFVTRRSGLRIGQYLTAFVAEHNLIDASLLITSVDISAIITTDGAGSNTMEYRYSVSATEGPNTGNWAKLFSQALK